MKVSVKIAETREDVLRCQYLIAEVYNREYEVVFSEDHYDLDAKIEPWPHRYLMVMCGPQLVSTVGQYLKQTYVERFGAVTHGDVAQILEGAGALDRYSPERLRELTKLVVAKEHRGQGLALFTLGAAHSRIFCQMEATATAPALLVFCSKRSIVQKMHVPLGVNTRHIKPFPFYKIHELYRSEDDPMDSRLIVPELDIPTSWFELAVPGEYETTKLVEGKA